MKFSIPTGDFGPWSRVSYELFGSQPPNYISKEEALALPLSPYDKFDIDITCNTSRIYKKTDKFSAAWVFIPTTGALFAYSTK